MSNVQLFLSTSFLIEGLTFEKKTVIASVRWVRSFILDEKCECSAIYKRNDPQIPCLKVLG